MELSESKDETAWLIEQRGNIPFYWTGNIIDKNFWERSSDIKKAVRFSTKNAAENVLLYLQLRYDYLEGKGDRLRNVNAVGHMFCNAPSHTDLDCAKYLKDGETPAQRIERALKDIAGLMAQLAGEKRKIEETRRELQAIREVGKEMPEVNPVAAIGNWGKVEFLCDVYPQLGDKLYPQSAIDAIRLYAQSLAGKVK